MAYRWRTKTPTDFADSLNPRMNQPKRYIMREIDWKRLPKWVLSKYNIDWEPITRSKMERRATWYLMKGTKTVAHAYLHTDYPKEMLDKLPGTEWAYPQHAYHFFKWNKQDELVSRYAIHQPDHRIGLLTVRKRLY